MNQESTDFAAYRFTPMEFDPLFVRARRLWPDSVRNQREWMRAVEVVRDTARGWQLDNPIKHREAS